MGEYGGFLTFCSRSKAVHENVSVITLETAVVEERSKCQVYSAQLCCCECSSLVEVAYQVNWPRNGEYAVVNHGTNGGIHRCTWEKNPRVLFATCRTQDSGQQEEGVCFPADAMNCVPKEGAVVGGGEGGVIVRRKRDEYQAESAERFEKLAGQGAAFRSVSRRFAAFRCFSLREDSHV